MQVYPIRLRPKVCERVWGAERLWQRFGRQVPEGRVVGESWEVFGELTIENGPYAGISLDQLLQEWGEQLLGRPVSSTERFPLLVKWINTNDWLSVQVHPDDAVAKRLTQCDKASGKTECWYILEAQAGAELIFGLKEDASLNDCVQAQGSRILDYLQRVRVTAGDTYFIGSGTVHALGPGISLLEVQQSSDITYRFYDWERLGLDGKNRPLHLAQAHEAILHSCPVSQLPAPEVVAGRGLCHCPYFVMDLLEVAAPVTGEEPGAGYCQKWDLSGLSVELLAFLEGQGRVLLDGASLSVCGGDVVLLPACAHSVTVYSMQPTQLVRILLPPTEAAP